MARAIDANEPTENSNFGFQTTAAPVAPIASVAAAPSAAQITIPVDVRGAAQAILQNFSRQQVTELVVLLHRVISNSKQN